MSAAAGSAAAGSSGGAPEPAVPRKRRNSTVIDESVPKKRAKTDTTAPTFNIFPDAAGLSVLASLGTVSDSTFEAALEGVVPSELATFILDKKTAQVGKKFHCFKSLYSRIVDGKEERVRVVEMLANLSGRTVSVDAAECACNDIQQIAAELFKARAAANEVAECTRIGRLFQVHYEGVVKGLMTLPAQEPEGGGEAIGIASIENQGKVIAAFVFSLAAILKCHDGAIYYQCRCCVEVHGELSSRCWLKVTLADKTTGTVVWRNVDTHMETHRGNFPQQFKADYQGWLTDKVVRQTVGTQNGGAGV
eukprot:c19264_g2_i1.p1 GENE.c19264_g2_i1~~c19264_g2_i1.p1  ORF type:complete len:306 (+),score=42.71 c19264_g2_i1:215-1132(+)